MPAWRDIFKDFDLDLVGCLASLFLAGALISWRQIPFALTILAIFNLLFVPGYLGLCALYPGKNDLERGAHWSGSVGLSILITGWLGLVISLTIGMTVTTLYLALAAWDVGMTGVAWRRRKTRLAIKLPGSPARERLGKFLIAARSLMATGRWQVVAAALVIFAAGRLFMITAQAPTQYSEFYLLGGSGKLARYIEFPVAGKLMKVTPGIINHEGRPVDYWLAYRIGDNKPTGLMGIRLQPEEKWEASSFVRIPAKSAIQKIEFLLYLDNETEATYRLHLWVNSVDENASQ